MGSGEAVRGESPALVPVLLSAAVPGVATYRRYWILGSVLFAAGVVFPLTWLVLWIMHAGSWVALGLDRRFLGQLVAVLVIVVVSRVAAVTEVLLSSKERPRRGVRFGVAIAVLQLDNQSAGIREGEVYVQPDTGQRIKLVEIIHGALQA